MLTFDYRVVARGWAEADISDERATATLRASFLEDALSNLLTAVEAIAAGAIEARAFWVYEPGEYRWILRHDEAGVHIQVLATSSYGSRAGDDTGTLVFETRQSVIDVVTAMTHAAQAVLDEMGEHGYQALWVEHPFPKASLQRLQAFLDRAHEE